MEKTKQYLYKIKPIRSDLLTTGPNRFEEELISKHFNYLKRLTDEGIVILAGRTLNADESSFGIVVFEAESENEAEKIMLNDPAVKHNVFSAKLFPYSVALLRK